MVTTSIAAKVPSFAFAFNLMAAYVLLALLAMRLIPELMQLTQYWR